MHMGLLTPLCDYASRKPALWLPTVSPTNLLVYPLLLLELVKVVLWPNAL